MRWEYHGVKRHGIMLFTKVYCYNIYIVSCLTAVTRVIDTLTQEDFHGAFQKLLERYKCIAAGGDYFEED